MNTVLSLSNFHQEYSLQSYTEFEDAGDVTGPFEHFTTKYFVWTVLAVQL